MNEGRAQAEIRNLIAVAIEHLRSNDLGAEQTALSQNGARRNSPACAFTRPQAAGGWI
jgi:hypothetical protein